MTYKFGRKSKSRLKSLHPDLKFVLEEAIQIVDFSVIETWRSKERQNFLRDCGKSKLKWPRSKHNTKDDKPNLVRAVDVVPYPIDWNDRERFILLAGIIMGIADYNNIELRWGGAWKGLGHMASNNFDDLPHFELL